ncbi:MULTISPECIES: DUF805 domain-containing protein [unclassified Glutamicibacter]|uniref:DUF805 domain-containing protein n=1 Tax=unclassified Glutamicibacter TaxID=2627139 RepID=UPI00403431BA
MSDPVYPPNNPYATSETESLSLPLYGASFGEAVKRFFKKYATFSGRASLSEYWWVALFNFIVGFVAVIAMFMSGALAIEPGAVEVPTEAVVVEWIVNIYGLATLIPNISIAVRRLHDANFSGWLYLLALVPILGTLALLILTLMPANPVGTRFDKRELWPGSEEDRYGNSR